MKKLTLTKRDLITMKRIEIDGEPQPLSVNIIVELKDAGFNIYGPMRKYENLEDGSVVYEQDDMPIDRDGNAYEPITTVIRSGDTFRHIPINRSELGENSKV